MSLDPEELPRTGEWLRYLQELLARVGYWGTDRTETYDQELAEAVTLFQRDHGLEEDGVPRGPTWVSLAEAAGGESLDLEIDWASSFPEIYRVAVAENFDDYLRRVVEIDPRVFEDGPEPEISDFGIE